MHFVVVVVVVEKEEEEEEEEDVAVVATARCRVTPCPQAVRRAPHAQQGRHTRLRAARARCQQRVLVAVHR